MRWGCNKKERKVTGRKGVKVSVGQKERWENKSKVSGEREGKWQRERERGRLEHHSPPFFPGNHHFLPPFLSLPQHHCHNIIFVAFSPFLTFTFHILCCTSGGEETHPQVAVKLWLGATAEDECDWQKSHSTDNILDRYLQFLSYLSNSNPSNHVFIHVLIDTC